MFKIMFLVFGWTSLSLGLIGAVLPILPTVPFLILAAYCFSKGSDKWHQWLLNHHLAGPQIRDWHEHRIIRRKSKIVTTIMMLPLFGYSLFLTIVPVIGRIALAVVTGLVLAVIWSYPSERENSR